MNPGTVTTDFDGLKLQYSSEAEQSVLGSILIDSECLSRVIQILPRADYFYLSNHKAIYSAMIDMFTMGQPVDYITVLDKLQSTSDTDNSNFKSYLLDLAQIVPSVSNVEFYADIVKDKYNIRNLVSTARTIIDDASSGDVSSSDLLNSAEQKIFDIRRGKETQGLQRVNEIVVQTFDRLDELNSRTDEEYSGVPTGIRDLDRVIMGLNKTDLILIASRPGMGKTSFSLNIAGHVGITKGKTVAIFSLEMSKEQLVSRMLSTQAKIPGQTLRLGKLNDQEWLNLIEAGDIISKAPIYIDDTPGITIPEMKAKLRRLGDVDLVIIDYLQLMSSAK